MKMSVMAAVVMILMGPTVFGQTNVPATDGAKMKKWIPGQGWIRVPVSAPAVAETNKPYPIIEGKWKETGTGVILVVENAKDAVGKVKDGYWTGKMTAGGNGKFTGTLTRDGKIESAPGRVVLKGSVSGDGARIAGTRTKDGKAEPFEWTRIDDDTPIPVGPNSSGAKKDKVVK